VCGSTEETNKGQKKIYKIIYKNKQEGMPSRKAMHNFFALVSIPATAGFLFFPFLFSFSLICFEGKPHSKA
jgi:hypothetical protein